MKVFVTGGTGNIGQYVVRSLLAAGHDVVLYTRTPHRVRALSEQAGVTAVAGSILDLDTMKGALRGCDAVVHIALGWGNTPVEMIDHDTRVTAFLAQEAERAGVANFVYTSSTAAMGVFHDGIDETAPCRPVDLYGATKAASEAFLIGFNRYYDGQGVAGEAVSMRRNIIRPGYTFSNPAYEGGASQSDTRFRDLARSVLAGEDVVVSDNDGTQFLSSAQIAELYLHLVESDLHSEIVLGLGSTWTSWADIARMAVDLAEESTSRVVAPDGEERHVPELVSVEKMKRLFGLQFDATGALEEHVRWNLDRERRVMAGEEVHDVYHVW